METWSFTSGTTVELFSDKPSKQVLGTSSCWRRPGLTWSELRLEPLCCRPIFWTKGHGQNPRGLVVQSGHQPDPMIQVGISSHGVWCRFGAVEYAQKDPKSIVADVFRDYGWVIGLHLYLYLQDCGAFCGNSILFGISPDWILDANQNLPWVNHWQKKCHIHRLT